MNKYYIFIECINNLKSFLNSSYKIYGCEKIEKASNIYIRHNICYSLEDAVIIAKLENKHSIFSNFFVSLRSKNYNLLSARNKNNLREIIEMGHSVNLLILDKNFITLNAAEQSTYLLQEIEFCTKFIDLKIGSFSCCNPFGDKAITDDYLNKIYSLSSNFQMKNFYPISDIKLFQFIGIKSDYISNNLNFDIIMHPYFWNIIDFSSEKLTEKYNAFLELTYN